MASLPVRDTVGDQLLTPHPILDEAAAALDRAGRFLSALLAGADRVAA